MQSKKRDLPAMPFYFGDWRKAPEIRALDLDVRMIWFEMLGYMWESSERGYLTINGKPVITPVISRLIGVDITTMERAIEQMESLDVFSRREDGAIYSRKMVADEEKRAQKSNAGRKGMKSRYSSNNKNRGGVNGSVITPVITNSENENEIEIEDINSNKGVGKIHFQNQDITYPYPSDKFKFTWETWKNYLKEAHNKSLSGEPERMILRRLGDFNSEKAAINAIQFCLEKQWKNINFDLLPKDISNYGKVETTGYRLGAKRKIHQ